MNEIKACYRDIQRALEAGYPDHLIYKLLDRKGKCLMKFSRFTQAIEALETSLEKAKATIKDEKRLTMISSEIEKLTRNCQGRESVHSDPFDNSTKSSRMPKLGGCANPLIPSFSKALDLCYSKDVILQEPLCKLKSDTETWIFFRLVGMRWQHVGLNVEKLSFWIKHLSNLPPWTKGNQFAVIALEHP